MATSVTLSDDDDPPNGSNILSKKKHDAVVATWGKTPWKGWLSTNIYWGQLLSFSHYGTYNAVLVIRHRLALCTFGVIFFHVALPIA